MDRTGKAGRWAEGTRERKRDSRALAGFCHAPRPERRRGVKLPHSPRALAFSFYRFPLLCVETDRKRCHFLVAVFGMVALFLAPQRRHSHMSIGANGVWEPGSIKAVFADKKAPAVECVLWVARSMDLSDVKQEDAPDPLAWTLLQECQSNAGFRVDVFWKTLFPKVIPARSAIQDEGEGGDKVDGQPTMDLLDRLAGMRDRATGVLRGSLEAERLTHAQETAGSSPAPATTAAKGGA
jgi:hypothetical protein